MPTVNKTLLAGSANGFAVVGYSGFTSASIFAGSLRAFKSFATPGSFSADYKQNSSTNTYQDWEVPAGARITGIKLISASVSITGSFVSGINVQFYTFEANLGSFDGSGSYIDNSGGAVQNVSSSNLHASSDVNVEIILNAGVEFDESESYSDLEILINGVEIEVTYESDNGGMFFAVI